MRRREGGGRRRGGPEKALKTPPQPLPPRLLIQSPALGLFYPNLRFDVKAERPERPLWSWVSEVGCGKEATCTGREGRPIRSSDATGKCS